MIEISKDTKILIIGHSQAADSLFDRLSARSDHVEISRTPIKEQYDLVFDVDHSEPMNLKGFEYRQYLMPSHNYCLGISRTRKRLKETDDQFFKLTGDVLMSLQEKSVIDLRSELINLIKLRKMLLDELTLETEDAF